MLCCYFVLTWHDSYMIELRTNNSVKRLVSAVTPSQWGHCCVLCVTQHHASIKLRSVSGVTSKQQTHTCILFARASFVTVNGSLTNSGLSGHNGADCWEEDTLYHASHISLLAYLWRKSACLCYEGNEKDIWVLRLMILIFRWDLVTDRCHYGTPEPSLLSETPVILPLSMMPFAGCSPVQCSSVHRPEELL